MLPIQDPRMVLIKRIEGRMRQAGLIRYIVSPGGRQTIDVTHHLVNKRSALTWLLRRLEAEGVEQLGEPLGMNAVYFGDEVVLHGNDLTVAEVPGVLVFAVNELSHRVPFRTNVELPFEFTQETGPEATQAVLTSLAEFAEEMLGCLGKGRPLQPGQAVVAAWKELRLRRRLEIKCAQLLLREPPEPPTMLTYRRLGAAAATLTALTRCGECLDDFADKVIEHVNDIGMIGAHVRERQFETTKAQGFCHKLGL